MLRRQQYYNGDMCTGIATIHKGKLHYRKLVGDVDTLIRETDALSLPFSPGAEARRNGDRLYHGLTIAICRGLDDAGGAAGPRILERPDRDVVLLEQGSAIALQVQEVVERGRPWGYVGTGRHFADYYEMTGCMNGRRWSGTGTYPDEFLRELLLRLRRAIPFPSAIPDRSPAPARD